MTTYCDLLLVRNFDIQIILCGYFGLRVCKAHHAGLPGVCQVEYVAAFSPTLLTLLGKAVSSRVDKQGVLAPSGALQDSASWEPGTVSLLFPTLPLSFLLPPSYSRPSGKAQPSH